jgi:hypothetical protein
VPPLADDVRRDLRLAVHALRVAHRGCRFAPAVHAGELTGAAATWTEGPRERLDAGLRSEVAAALLSRALAGAGRPAVWLTRPGVPEPHDLDAAWLGPLVRVLAEAEVEPRCLTVVTRSGWYAPLTGERATWQRLRVRSR